MDVSHVRSVRNMFIKGMTAKEIGTQIQRTRGYVLRVLTVSLWPDHFVSKAVLVTPREAYDEPTLRGMM